MASFKDRRVSEKDVANYTIPVVKVMVGKSENVKAIYVHQNRLLKQSKFFQKALSGPWKEADERVVNLPDCEAHVFAVYVHYLYHGTIAVKIASGPGTSMKDNAANASREHIRLSKLYVMAEMLMDIKTKNEVLDAMLSTSRELRMSGTSNIPGITSIQTIYNGTPPGSPARRFVVDCYVYRGVPSFLTKHTVTWPADFLYELSVQLLDKREFPCRHDPTKSGRNLEYKEAEDEAKGDQSMVAENSSKNESGSSC